MVLTYDRPLSLLKTALSHQLAFVLNHAAKIQLFSPRRAVFPKSETAFPWERDVWGERWGLRALISPFVLSVFSFGLPSLTFDNPSTAPSRFDRDTQSRSKPLPPRGVQEQLSTRKSGNCWFSQKLRWRVTPQSVTCHLKNDETTAFGIFWDFPMRVHYI